MSLGPPASPKYPPVLPNFLQTSRAEITKKFIDLEWQQRHRLAHGLQETQPSSQWARLSGDEIARRNRYLNIDPWASNRVPLRVPEGQCDYINASPISLRSSRTGVIRRYIATQGPTEQSTAHFWRMIWHETGPVGVIVMLTQTHEAGREKCFEYFPAALKDESPDFKPLPEEPTTKAPPETPQEVTVVIQPDDQELIPARDSSQSAAEAASPSISVPTSPAASQNAISDVSETDTTPSSPPPKTHTIHFKPSASSTEDSFHLNITLQSSAYDMRTRSTVRQIQLTSGAETKTVHHYLFNGWPDFQTPEGEDRAALVELCQATADKAAEGSVADGTENPRVVHCSAGVGRSGTFIALDYLMAELEDGALDGSEAATGEGGGSGVGHARGHSPGGNGAEGGDRIAETVNELRKQRMMMVQGDSQFCFLYEILRELWETRHGVVRSASASPLPSPRLRGRGDWGGA